MNISKKLAAQIVEAVYEVVKKDTNLISFSGIIIGSTDDKRIGTYHAAGAYAINHGCPSFVDKDHPFQGAKDGINYPIFLDGPAIAAIGITGDPDELKPFGFLAAKITEVFLKEQQLNQAMLSKDRALHYLITSLIYDNITDQRQLDLLIREFEIDPMAEYAVLTVKFTDPVLEQSLRFYFHSLGCRLSLYLYPNEWVVIFDKTSLLQFRSAEFATRYKGKITAGLGNPGGLYQISHSYHNARAARRYAGNQGQEFCDIRDISLGFLLESIPSDIRDMYSQKLLSHLTGKELQILDRYLANNLSLKDTAASLFMHKNTLQYQLDRITEKTGLNPRVFQDAYLLQSALSVSTPEQFTERMTGKSCY